LTAVSNRTISSPIMNIRRLPGFMYHHKLATVLLAFGILLVYLLLHWGVMCTNLEAWRHVSTVVSQIAPIGERSTARSRHAALAIRRVNPLVERSDAGLRERERVRLRDRARGTRDARVRSAQPPSEGREGSDRDAARARRSLLRIASDGNSWHVRRTAEAFARSSFFETISRAAREDHGEKMSRRIRRFYLNKNGWFLP